MDKKQILPAAVVAGSMLFGASPVGAGETSIKQPVETSTTEYTPVSTTTTTGETTTTVDTPVSIPTGETSTTIKPPETTTPTTQLGGGYGISETVNIGNSTDASATTPPEQTTGKLPETT